MGLLFPRLLRHVGLFETCVGGGLWRCLFSSLLAFLRHPSGGRCTGQNLDLSLACVAQPTTGVRAPSLSLCALFFSRCVVAWVCAAKMSVCILPLAAYSLSLGLSSGTESQEDSE